MQRFLQSRKVTQERLSTVDIHAIQKKSERQKEASFWHSNLPGAFVASGDFIPRLDARVGSTNHVREATGWWPTFMSDRAGIFCPK